MRLTRFYGRFRNQYRIHKNRLSLWTILRISWIQSKENRVTNIVEPYDGEVVNL